MKKTLLFVITALLFNMYGHSTIHVVLVSNFQFSPSSMNIFVGDTVRFNWVSGNHTTTCDPTQDPNTSFPAGAASWDRPIKSSSPNFDYKVTVVGTYNYVCLPHAPNMAGSFVAQQNLPLKLSSFSLTSSGIAVALNWKTASEENTERFSVRRSYDGVNYTEIATIPAAGNSNTEKVYSYMDNNIANQKFLYYNIATVDRDGKRLFSETKLYRNTKAGVKFILSLSPNPVDKTGHINMTFNAEKVGQMKVNVINADGKTIMSRYMQTYVGVNKGHIHLGEQPSGTYTLTCTIDDVTESHQILVK